MAGYIKTYRKVRDHWIWKNPERYRAWSDMLMEAAYRPYTKPVGGEMIEIPRGGLAASERYLSDRWKWSTTKVRTFLRDLALDHMIKREVKRGCSIITICNYDSYNPPDSGTKAPTVALDVAVQKQHESEIKEGKEGKERKNGGETRTRMPASLDDCRNNSPPPPPNLEKAVGRLLVAAGIRTAVTSLTPQQFQDFSNFPALRNESDVRALCKRIAAYVAERKSARRYTTNFLIKDLPNLLDEALADDGDSVIIDKYANGF